MTFDEKSLNVFVYENGQSYINKNTSLRVGLCIKTNWFVTFELIQKLERNRNSFVIKIHFAFFNKFYGIFSLSTIVLLFRNQIFSVRLCFRYVLFNEITTPEVQLFTSFSVTSSSRAKRIVKRSNCFYVVSYRAVY